MNTTTNTSTASMTTIACGQCGGVYAITTARYNHDREHGESWSCPYCRCGWGFAGSTSPLALAQQKAERLERTAQELREARDILQRRVIAQKAVTTRIKNRIKNGVCPWCNRTFSNLARHMASKHPDFKDGGEE